MTINAAAEIASSLGYGIDPQGSLLLEHASPGLKWLENEQPGCFMTILQESNDYLIPLSVFDITQQPFLYRQDRLPIAHHEQHVSKTQFASTVARN
jgi:hypothetical protein